VRGRLLSARSTERAHADGVDVLVGRVSTALTGRGRVLVGQPFAATEDSAPRPDLAFVPATSALIEVHREPTPRGYRVVTTYRRGERVALLAFPDVTIAVDDIVPA
jgi:hypothetical protein